MDVRQWFEVTVPKALSSEAGAPALLDSDIAVAFDVVGTGRWEVRGCPDGRGVCVRTWDGGRRDCIVRCDADTLERLLGGGIGAARAYASGRAMVEGDIGLLLRLRDALAERGIL